MNINNTIEKNYHECLKFNRSPKIRSSMMKLCQSGMGIMICILCMSAKLSKLWHAKFGFAALRFNLKRTIPDI